MTEAELIVYVKPYLKKQGFLKKNKRWTKIEGEFTINFFIQGSSYDKDNYYIRPGIFLNAVSSDLFYGHFMTEISQMSPEQVVNDFEAFCKDWTNKEYIKKTLLEFKEWETRNPLEKRRAGLCDYDKDHVPSEVCFSIPTNVINYILENF